MYKASLFSPQNVSFAACLQFIDYSLVIIPENVHSHYSLEFYTYLTCIQGLPKPTNVPVEKHINYPVL